MEFDQAALLRTFRLEAEDLLCELERLAFALDERPDDVALVAEMFRCAHTLKGGASCVGFERVMLHAYELEGLYEAITSQRRFPNRRLSALSLDAVSFLRQGVRVDAALAAEPIPDEQQFITRILDWIDDSANDSAKLDSLSGAKSLSGESQRTLRVEVERLDDLLSLTQELSIAADHLRPVAAANGSQAAWQIFEPLMKSLRVHLLGLRLVPVGPTLEQLGRPARDLSHGLGKPVELAIEGREVKVDVSLCDSLRGPLAHLVRNAIAHGIETPEQRCNLGKDPVGRISLKARDENDFMVLEVVDDGAGIDSNDDLTALCGRGGGIAAVHHQIEALGGTVTLDSIPGRGVTVMLRIPRTAAAV